MSFRTQSNNLIKLTSVEVALFGRSTQIDRKNITSQYKTIYTTYSMLLESLTFGHVAYRISAAKDSSSCWLFCHQQLKQILTKYIQKRVTYFMWSPFLRNHTKIAIWSPLFKLNALATEELARVKDEPDLRKTKRKNWKREEKKLNVTCETEITWCYTKLYY